MPYIPSSRRTEVCPSSPGCQMQTVGELAYVLMGQCLAYVHQHGLTFCTLPSVMGAIQSVDMGFKRQVVEPYEESAILRNGSLDYSRQSPSGSPPVVATATTTNAPSTEIAATLPSFAS